MSTLDTQLVAGLAPAFKTRNAGLDALFYDIGALTPEEQASVGPGADEEGALIVVPPGGSTRRIRHHPDIAHFLAAEGDTVQALVVAGVGSSALGTAALARNVADAYGLEVAGLVSGYGASDLLSEALGGWFFYGATDRFRHGLREMSRRLEARATPAPAPATRGGRVGARAKPATPLADLDALGHLLAAAPPRLRLLVGHSKGCLMIDHALESHADALRRQGRESPLFERLHLVTFGAVCDLPPVYRHRHQFLGALDSFGGLNSRLDLPFQRLPGAWHHLNRRWPAHVDVAACLRRELPAVFEPA